MLHIVLVILLCFAPAISPYSTYTDRQAVYCKATTNTDLACYDTPTSKVFFNTSQAVDPSEEGYNCYWIARNYTNLTNSYVCFNQDVLVRGELYTGWIVRDYNEEVSR